MADLNAEQAKRRAAAAALKLVAPGMRLGLGSGTTAAQFVDLLGAKVAEGLDVLCVPTSEGTKAQAAALHIPLTAFESLAELDLTVDGADEFDPERRLIKGGGGALWREKIVAAASKRMIVIADASKAVATLGKYPLPIEVSRFGFEASRQAIVEAGRTCGLFGDVGLRTTPQGEPFITDAGNYLVDCRFDAILAPEDLAQKLSAIPGVIEHGLFIGLAKGIIVAGPQDITILGQLE